MGGPGSGNWYRWDAKLTVESCLSLDVNKLARDGVLKPWCTGELHWTNTQTGERTAWLHYSTEATAAGGLILRLAYRVNNTEDIDLPIVLQCTRPHFGGSRWWFTCPLIVNGRPCRRRVGKLYFRGRYYGCRHCHDLTYRSCQEAHQAERIFGCDARMARLLTAQLSGK